MIRGADVEAVETKTGSTSWCIHRPRMPPSIFWNRWTPNIVSRLSAWASEPHFGVWCSSVRSVQCMWRLGGESKFGHRRNVGPWCRPRKLVLRFQPRLLPPSMPCTRHDRTTLTPTRLPSGSAARDFAPTYKSNALETKSGSRKILMKIKSEVVTYCNLSR